MDNRDTESLWSSTGYRFRRCCSERQIPLLIANILLVIAIVVVVVFTLKFKCKSEQVNPKTTINPYSTLAPTNPTASTTVKPEPTATIQPTVSTKVRPKLTIALTTNTVSSRTTLTPTRPMALTEMISPHETTVSPAKWKPNAGLRNLPPKAKKPKMTTIPDFTAKTVTEPAPLNFSSLISNESFNG